MVRAGYIDDKGTLYNKSKIGIPQGSVVSPILCNIVMDQVDKYLTNYIDNFNKGKMAKMSQEYSRISEKIRAAKRFSEKLLLSKIRSKMRRSIPNNDNYKRMKFVRYADDILIGVIGSKMDCRIIKSDLNTFIKKIGLTLSDTKTKITYSSDPVHFLGYNIHITPFNKRPTIKVNLMSEKTINRYNSRTRPIINAPTNDIILKLEALGISKNGLLGIPTSLGRLVHEEHRTIILYYKSIGNGLLNYYRIATNFKSFRNRIAYIIFYSFVLTIARKYKLKTMRGAFKKFGTKFTCYKIDNKGNKVIDLDFDKRYFENIEHIKEHKQISRLFVDILNPDQIMNKFKYMLPRSNKLFKSPCQICGSNINVEIHHVKHLKDIKDTTDYLKTRQIKMNRKQIPLCKECHIKVHKGQYNGPGL